VKIFAQILIRLAVLLTIPCVYFVLGWVWAEDGMTGLMRPFTLIFILWYLTTGILLFSLSKKGRIMFLCFPLLMMVSAISNGIDVTGLRLETLSPIIFVVGFGALLFLPPLRRAFEL
jgi:hypothetical protein